MTQDSASPGGQRNAKQMWLMISINVSDKGMSTVTATGEEMRMCQY